ncbi:Hypothetical protein POVN_LOCUS635 [uncultured virus]|nr:Hypothetical protein POVN_LOCUS635 [uncultured virus]
MDVLVILEALTARLKAARETKNETDIASLREWLTSDKMEMLKTRMTAEVERLEDETQRGIYHLIVHSLPFAGREALPAVTLKITKAATYGQLVSVYRKEMNAPDLYLADPYGGNVPDPDELVTSEWLEEGRPALRPYFNPFVLDGLTFVGNELKLAPETLAFLTCLAPDKDTAHYKQSLETHTGYPAEQAKLYVAKTELKDTDNPYLCLREVGEKRLVIELGAEPTTLHPVLFSCPNGTILKVELKATTQPEALTAALAPLLPWRYKGKKLSVTASAVSAEVSSVCRWLSYYKSVSIEKRLPLQLTFT